MYAAATNPNLLPKDESDVKTNRQIRHPHSSLPSRGLNDYASKMTSTILPTSGNPFISVDLPPEIKESANTDQLNELSTLSKLLQDMIHQEILSSNARDIFNVAFKHIAAIGDIVVYQEGMEFSYYRLDNFVIKRDVNGDPLTLILRKFMREEELDASQIESLKKDNVTTVRRNSSTFYPYYIKVDFTKDKQTVTEYLGNMPIGKPKTYTDKQPYMVLQYRKDAYEDYSTSLVEENYGDIVSCHALRETALQAMAVSTIGYIGLIPGSLTPTTLSRTPNWGVVPIKDESTIRFFQPDAVQTVTTTTAFAEVINQEIRRIFLMDIASELTHDRTTAFQVSKAIQAVENSAGPMLSLIRSSLLKPVAMNTINYLIEKGRVGSVVRDYIDDGTLVIDIKSGVAAFDSENEDNKVFQFFLEMAQVAPEQTAKRFNVDQLIVWRAKQKGIPAELLYSDDEIEQNQQEAQINTAQQSLLENVGPAAESILTEQIKGNLNV